MKYVEKIDRDWAYVVPPKKLKTNVKVSRTILEDLKTTPEDFKKMLNDFFT